MNNLEFVEKVRKIERDYNTVYALGMFGQLITENSINQKANQKGIVDWYTSSKKAELRNLIGKNYYGFDCVCLIKAIFWGFCEGNLKYNSNGVPDIGADTMIGRCNEISTNFGSIAIGEVVWLKGHIGIYIGNGQVIEATPAWKNNVQVTNLSQRNWTKHGKLPYIEYTSEVVKPETPPSQGNTYRIVSGDTLSRIAERYGTTVDGIVNANKSKYPNMTRNYIQANWDITIPSGNVASESIEKRKTVTPDVGLILRQNASVSSRRIYAYSKGTVVTIIKENAATADGLTWDYVKIGNYQGYMASKYLR